MAFTVTAMTALSGEYTKVWDITASADGDTASPDILHTLGAIPASVTLTELTAAGQISEWFASTIDATKVIVTKGTGAGSGAATPQLRLIVSLPHSIVK